MPIWATPAMFAFIFVGCLLACFRQRSELLHTVDANTAARMPLRREAVKLQDYDELLASPLQAAIQGSYGHSAAGERALQ